MVKTGLFVDLEGEVTEGCEDRKEERESQSTRQLAAVARAEAAGGSGPPCCLPG